MLCCTAQYKNSIHSQSKHLQSTILSATQPCVRPTKHTSTPDQTRRNTKETTIVIYRKIPTVSMTSQTRTGKINTTILIAINIQSYQRLRRLIHKYSNRHCAQACTMTSQYPVKIHVVASCSILHNKITVPASNGKLTCLVQNQNKLTPFYYRLEIKPEPTDGETILTNYFLFSTKHHQLSEK